MKLICRTPQKARIEIIPMIDTVFFLLVFFMMASRFNRKERDRPNTKVIKPC